MSTIMRGHRPRSVELARQPIALRYLSTTGVYLQGIDTEEIIAAIRRRPPSWAGSQKR